jgi:hypothetical protein
VSLHLQQRRHILQSDIGANDLLDSLVHRLAKSLKNRWGNMHWLPGWVKVVLTATAHSQGSDVTVVAMEPIDLGYLR